jgi:hypothetical protein
LPLPPITAGIPRATSLPSCRATGERTPTRTPMSSLQSGTATEASPRCPRPGARSRAAGRRSAPARSPICPPLEEGPASLEQSWMVSERPSQYDSQSPRAAPRRGRGDRQAQKNERVCSANDCPGTHQHRPEVEHKRGERQRFTKREGKHNERRLLGVRAHELQHGGGEVAKGHGTCPTAILRQMAPSSTRLIVASRIDGHHGTMRRTALPSSSVAAVQKARS